MREGVEQRSAVLPSAVGEDLAERFGPDPRMRAVHPRTDVRKLPERLHQPHSARPVDRYARVTLPRLRRSHSMARQHSSAELAISRWQMSGMSRSYFAALSCRRVTNRNPVRFMLCIFRPKLAGREVLHLQFSIG